MEQNKSPCAFIYWLKLEHIINRKKKKKKCVDNNHNHNKKSREGETKNTNYSACVQHDDDDDDDGVLRLLFCVFQEFNDRRSLSAIHAQVYIHII